MKSLGFLNSLTVSNLEAFRSVALKSNLGSLGCIGLYGTQTREFSRTGKFTKSSNTGATHNKSTNSNFDPRRGPKKPSNNQFGLKHENTRKPIDLSKKRDGPAKPGVRDFGKKDYVPPHRVKFANAKKMARSKTKSLVVRRKVILPSGISQLTLKEYSDRTGVHSAHLLLLLFNYIPEFFDEFGHHFTKNLIHLLESESSKLDEDPLKTDANKILANLNLTPQQMNTLASTLNISVENAELLAMQLDLEIVSASDDEGEFKLHDFRNHQGSPRSPVVTVMGHVDHGKTTLLDTLRNADVASGEAGGITQSVGAFRVSLDQILKNAGVSNPDNTPRAASENEFLSSVVFLDTPGHEAFDTMRSSGAKVTDIALVVISAVDGVMPQTIEAINLARHENVPIIIALTKIDALVSAKRLSKMPYEKILQIDALQEVLDKVTEALLHHKVETDIIGGATPIVPIAAPLHIGLPKLLETVLQKAVELDLRARRDVPGEALVIESRVDKHFGMVCDMIVTTGKFSIGDVVISNEHFAKIKKLLSSKNATGEESGQLLDVDTVFPSDPVRLIGFSDQISPGDSVLVVESLEKAHEMVKIRQTSRQRLESSLDLTTQKASKKSAATVQSSKLQKDILAEETLKKLQEKIRSDDIISFMQNDWDAQDPVIQPVVLRADTSGALQALRHSIDNMNFEVQQQAVEKSQEIKRIKEKILASIAIPSSGSNANKLTDPNANTFNEVTALQELHALKPSLPLNSGFKVVKEDIGAITDQDVKLAATFENLAILGFNVRSLRKDNLIPDEKILTHGVIYHLLEDAKRMLYNRTGVVEHLNVLGKAEVMDIFELSGKKRQIVAGCKVMNGVLEKRSRIRVLRDNKIIFQTSGIQTLRVFQEAVNSVRAGQECGLTLGSFAEFSKGDIIEAFELSSVSNAKS